MNQSTLTARFIEQIWNNNSFDRLHEFLHPDFIDHSLPPSFPPNAEGLQKWVSATSVSFQHKTIIEEQVTENNTSIIKIRMELKHTGTWRDLEATGIELSTAGYRCFKYKNGLIIAHWALIDGQAIENQISHAAKGCKINA